MSVRRPWLLPLAPLYGAALAFKKQMFAWGWLKRSHLESTVISVGSVSAGGAGKTPVVLMLASILRHRGYAVRILTRGYKRQSDAISRVDPFDDARWHGDEPVLLAQRSGVPVYVGADRYQAGVMAEQAEPSEKLVVHLLDDGFQHRRLARDIDIVLLTQEDVDDALLPAGNLREPLEVIGQADVVILREEEADSLRGVVNGLSGATGKPALWLIRRRLSLGEGGEVALPTIPLAFCGIARPNNFISMLKAQGYEPAKAVSFEDHHAYSEADIAHLLQAARAVEANGFVTTEKDAVKLTPVMRDRLETIGPVVVARLCVELVNEKQVLEQLVTTVGRLDRRRR
ncbi:tetraacyldisaccharide 4'-kinase [Granulicella sp. S190]|uniref:tetraacyldisaccharide 4'-kinase n=1 Tax=Granulicella sp. S190 TaxID=1747226 RepID=UPI00131E685F|nr:tetraacyldisaccharide 4'-kinase [Granulicella sp. S190]